MKTWRVVVHSGAERAIQTAIVAVETFVKRPTPAEAYCQVPSPAQLNTRHALLLCAP
jgi:hypothetical protein